MNPAQDLIVVIRSSGERTEALCRELVLREMPIDRVHIVRAFPFEKTLSECFRIGRDSDAKWMMTLDADVLLRQGAIHDFLNEAGQLPDHFFHTEGLIFDKLTGRYRKAGHRMYRVSMLEKAMGLIPEAGSEIRPEFTTVNRMAAAGFLSRETSTVYGIHDFEQYFEDVYRKCFVHARKHREWVGGLIEYWQGESDDADFRIALKALYDGLTIGIRVSIDKRLFSDMAEKALADVGLTEKQSISDLNQIEHQVEDVLAAAGPVPVDQRPGDILHTKPGRKEFLNNLVAQKGYWGALKNLSGLGLLRVGRHLTGEK